MLSGVATSGFGLSVTVVGWLSVCRMDGVVRNVLSSSQLNRFKTGSTTFFFCMGCSISTPYRGIVGKRGRELEGQDTGLLGAVNGGESGDGGALASFNLPY